MIEELRAGERFRLNVEGGLIVEGLVTEATDKHVAVAPPDIVPWGKSLRFERKQIYHAHRIWQRPPPPPIDPTAATWEEGAAWLIWSPGTEPKRRKKRKRKAGEKPLLEELADDDDSSCI